MAFGFPRSRMRPRDGVPVTSAQVAAAKLIIERAQTSNKPVEDAVVAIANAEPVPGTSDFRVLEFRRSTTGNGPVAPAGGAPAR